ncbi:FxLYD domain-containing protein [Halocatena salina]
MLSSVDISTTQDIEPGRTWQFNVVILESVVDIADHDITVLGIPG